MHGVYKQGDLPYLNVKLCPNCEHLVDKDINECPNCSYSFLSEKVIKEEVKEETDEFKDIHDYVLEKQLDIIPHDDVEDVAEEEPVLPSEEDDKTIYCQNCGAKMSFTQKYCGVCGQEVHKKKCPACHQVLDSSLSYCIYCGQKLLNIEESKEDVNNLIIKNPLEEEENSENDTLKTDEIEMNEVNNDLDTSEIEKSLYKCNVAKKRIFIVFQLLTLSIVTLLMIFFPLFTKENIFTDIGLIFKGEIHDTMNFKDLFGFIIDSIKNSSFNLKELSLLLSNGNHEYMFTCYPFIEFFIKSEDVSTMLSFIFVSIFYASMCISLMVMLITSIVGWFRKTPLAGKSMRWLLICNTFGLLTIYFNNLTNSFKGYDSWIIYSFVLVFIIWFIIKLSFLKDVRLYKKNKKGNYK